MMSTRCCVVVILVLLVLLSVVVYGQHTVSLDAADTHYRLGTLVTPSFDDRPSPSRPRANERVIFAEDFDELDFDTWQHELTLGGGGNWEFEAYRNNRSNSFVRSSVLHIRPTLTSDTIGADNVLNGYTMDIWGGAPADVCTGPAFYGCSRSSGGGRIINPIHSARLRTVDSFNFKYGRVEVSARVPVGDWLWSAIWMLPQRNAYGPWPASGEIDIMESRGNDIDYGADSDGDIDGAGHNSFGSTLHWGPFASINQYKRTSAWYTMPHSKSLHDAFHIYGLVWSADGIRTYLDVDDEQHRVLDVDFTEKSMWSRGHFQHRGLDNPWSDRPNAAPFDQKFYFVLNLAVGGTSQFFPDGVALKPWNNSDEDAPLKFLKNKKHWAKTWSDQHSDLEVDWIRVYQHHHS